MEEDGKKEERRWRRGRRHQEEVGQLSEGPAVLVTRTTVATMLAISRPVSVK